MTEPAQYRYTVISKYAANASRERDDPAMNKSLYDILEVSTSASPEAIRAAYERLSARLDPLIADNQGKEEARLAYEAVKDAFFTLSDPRKRERYDRNHGGRIEPAITRMEVVPPFWTLPKLIAVALVVLIGGGWYYKHREVEARLAAERAVAEARAKEAEAKAKAAAEAAAQARLLERQEQDRLRREPMTRNELESARRSYEAERRRQETTDRYAQDRQAREKQMRADREENQRQRAEAAAVAEARARAAREREELCRIERERYGRSYSC